MPVFRVPIHATYLLYLARRSEKTAEFYLRAALFLCRQFGVEPSFLLHSLDFLGREDVSGLEFFPGMDLPGETKRRLIGSYVDLIADSHQIVTMGTHAGIAYLRDPKTRSVASLTTGSD